MLRSLVKNRHMLMAPRRAVSSVEPSGTTTVLLKNLSPSTTQISLRAAISEIVCRKVEMEPGCSIHVINEAEAIYVSKLVASKYEYEGTILNTTMPSLLLQNLPASVCSQRLKKAFGKFEPKIIRLIGTSSVQVITQSAEEALKVQQIVNEIVIDLKSFRSHTVKMPDHTFAVVVNNFHNSASAVDAEKAVRDALSGTFSEDRVSISTVSGAPKSASLRFNTTNAAEVETIVEALKKLNFNGQPLEVAAPTQIKKPALFIRNVRKIGEAKLVAVMSQMGCDRLRINDQSKDIISDLAVAFFPTEEAAFQALHQLKNISVEGVKIALSFREVAEPAVTVSNLPVACSEETVLALFESLKPVRVEITSTPSGSSAVVVLGGPSDVDLAVLSMSRKVVSGRSLTVTASPVHDTGINVTIPESHSGVASDDSLTPAALFSALLEAGVRTPKGISINTNISAFLNFMTIDEAAKAHHSFIEGSTIIDSSGTAGTNPGGLVTSHISAHPSYVVDVSGMDPEAPFQLILDALKGSDPKEEEGETLGSPTVNSLLVERSAIIKFKKARDVVFNMKKLRSMSVDGNKLKVKKYHQTVKQGDHEIDEEGREEVFDQYALMNVMKDYMYADKATRYQVVKNHFERAVNDAKNYRNHGMIVDESYSPAMVAEVKQLLSLPVKNALASDRLFELYIQRQDMNTFVHDFKETIAVMGPANPEDPFDWSQFVIEDFSDLTKHQEAFKLADANMLAIAQKASGLEPKISNNQRKRELLIKGDEGEEDEVVNLEKISELTDKEGRVWSGAILDTDQVQKPMPGGRVMSHRALVVVGNLRGAAGYGMGKAKTPSDAVIAAFRDALRNLVFVDLYEQFGFAHDLHGKHNSCHAYIKATGRNRMMVASPFATAVLERLGVGSASVKLVGRRDPYAMVRAIFNAVSKHENIDEFAKDRGKRYLNLKWLYDNDI